MSIKRYSNYILTLLFISFSIVGWAGSTSVNSVAARAGSMQAFTAVADDASAIFYNPGGLTQRLGTHIEGNFYFIFPNLYYKNSANDTVTRSKQFSFGNSIFLTTDKAEKIVLGFGVYAPNARSTNYDINAAVSNTNESATVIRIDFVPTVAVQIHDRVSIGAGFVTGYVNTDADSLGLRERSEGLGYTGQAGILVKLMDQFKVGFTYRGPMTSRNTGRGTYGGATDNYTSKVTFPAVYNWGAAWRVLPKLLLSFDYTREDWSPAAEAARRYADTTIDAIATTILRNRASKNLRFGILYNLSEQTELRAGYSNFEYATPADNISPAQPDYDTHVGSVGASYKLDKWRFDFGYEYTHAIRRVSGGATFPGQFKGNVHTGMLGLAYQIA